MNNSAIDFTLVHADELEEIITLYNAAKDGLRANGINQWDEFYPDKDVLLNDILRQEMYIGRAGGQAVCAFVLNCECDEQYANGAWSCPDAHFCVVHRLCVNPQYQHCGIGRKTMQYIELLAAGNGFDSIRLDTFTKNPFSVRLYEHLGYRITGCAEWRKGRFQLMEKRL